MKTINQEETDFLSEQKYYLDVVSQEFQKIVNYTNSVLSDFQSKMFDQPQFDQQQAIDCFDLIMKAFTEKTVSRDEWLVYFDWLDNVSDQIWQNIHYNEQVMALYKQQDKSGADYVENVFNFVRAIMNRIDGDVTVGACVAHNWKEMSIGLRWRHYFGDE